MRFAIRDRLVARVEVRDEIHVHTFLCHSHLERWRAETLLVKEEGTVRWIRDGVRSGDVIYDIGANIGVYTLLAAKRAGPGGHVYSFEPHVANARSLLANITENDLERVVTVLPIPLAAEEGVFRFEYGSLESGAAFNTLRTGPTDGASSTWSALNCATTVDRLLEEGHIRAPSLVKIDVDGNEFQVLLGMKVLLASSEGPREVQVEINPGERERIYRFMDECGYELTWWHDTSGGAVERSRGVSAEEIAYNAVFRQRAR